MEEPPHDAPTRSDSIQPEPGAADYSMLQREITRLNDRLTESEGRWTDRISVVESKNNELKNTVYVLTQEVGRLMHIVESMQGKAQ